MATERLSMRKIREILRQKWVLGRSHRAVAGSAGVSVGVVGSLMVRAKAAGLTWAEVEALNEDALEQRLYGPTRPVRGDRPLPDCATMHRELARPGVTLELLHLEYLQAHPNGYRYSRFCQRYQLWVARQRRSMRQVHKAGEKLFVDFAGQRPHLVDRHTGGLVPVELFVAVLGASSYTFVHATRTQRGPDWIEAHLRAFECFGGVPTLIVPDQLKAGVAQACRYEPTIQRTYEEMAAHYGTSVLPARPRHPQDKAKVEVGVQVVERWILARLRHQTFFSLEALNERIAELRDDLNARPMRAYGLSRRARFEQLEQPCLRPLPPQRFTYGEWKVAKVNIDDHVEIARHYYSVPHPLVGEAVEVRLSPTTVEVFFRGRRVASHVRRDEPGQASTVAEHMPKRHRHHQAWSPSRLIHWGQTIGPQTGGLVEEILAARPHPEQGYRSCLGLFRLAKPYGAPRLEAACARARAAGARSYKHVANILKNGLDRPAAPTRATPATPVVHENIRGEGYYTSPPSDHDPDQEVFDAQHPHTREAEDAAPLRHGDGLAAPGHRPDDDGCPLR